MAYRLTRLSPNLAPACASMTFPAYYSLLNGPGITFAAFQGDAPVGLALFLPKKDAHAAELLSLFVEPQYRSDGIGTALLRHAENSLASKGIRSLNTVWNDSMSGSSPFTQVLSKRRWDEPQRRMLVLKADMDGAFGQWIREQREQYETDRNLPRGYTLKSWQHMTAQDRRFIRSHQGMPDWHHAKDDPFREESSLVPDLSRLLLKNGEIAGWLTIHRTTTDTARITDVFIHQDLGRTTGVAIIMVIHGFWLLMNAGIPRMTWAIHSNNRPLATMCQRRLSHVSEQHWTWGATKALEK